MHRNASELEAGVAEIRMSPPDQGALAMIVRRGRVGAREVLDEATLDLADGLVGDTWRTRGSRRTPDGSADPELQITIMNARAAALIAVERDRWSLAGDQLYIDLDLSIENLPPGTRLVIASAVLEVTAVPHTGCAKFSTRFGSAAARFVNSPTGRALRIRGVNARVVVPGTVRTGDLIRKL